MQHDELVRRADANYFESMSRLASVMEGGEVREAGGILCINSGTTLAWFNIAFITRTLAEPESQIARAVMYFDDAQVPCIVRVREGVDPAAERAADALGLPYSDSVPGMVLPSLAGVPPNNTPGLIIKTAANDVTLDHHRALIAQNFDLPRAMGERYVPAAIVAVPDVALYVGYCDGVPVATSALIATHRVAGVYNVTCSREYRRRGFGEAITWHAVREGARIGCVMASLQSSEMGKPVYARMGFEEMISYRTFHRPGV